MQPFPLVFSNAGCTAASACRSDDPDVDVVMMRRGFRGDIEGYQTVARTRNQRHGRRGGRGNFIRGEQRVQVGEGI